MLFSKTIGQNNKIGNQMFQYAALQSKAFDLNCGLYLNNSILLEYFNIRNNKFNQMKSIKYKFVEGQDSFNNIKKNTELIGVFESEKYFKKYKDEIKEIFQIKDKKILGYCKNNIKSIRFNSTIIGIHINGTLKDFSKNSFLYNYLLKSFSLFNDISDKKFLIFTNKINRCKNIFKGSQYIFIENTTDIEDFIYMTLCDHLILCSDSNFGWWAGYLNDNPNKRIICPILSNNKKDWNNYWSNEFIVI